MVPESLQLKPHNTVYSPGLPTSTVERRGRIVQAIGSSLRATGLDATVGSRVAITSNASATPVFADVVGIDHEHLLLYPLGSLSGIATGSTVRLLEHGHDIAFSNDMLGRVFDGLGAPMDDLDPPDSESRVPIDAPSPSPLKRQSIDSVFKTGVRAIDALLTVGKGQRMGIFAAAGAGKSTLLAMLSRACVSDVIVIALVGERGREVGEFIHHTLDPQTRQRMVMVVSTSDRPAMERVLAARSATAIAEGFRAQGKSVLLLMDSVTRYARALREIGLSVGEPPVRRGYPPSVFAELPKLFERAGNDDRGSITAFYTVLTEGEDNLDPVAEETRSILDGHIVLTRTLGEAGHYPAIDVLRSTSRLFNSLVTAEHQRAALRFRQMLAKYADIEFLLQVGEYSKGSDTLGDEAIQKYPHMLTFLQQSHTDICSLEDTQKRLMEISR